MTIQGRKIKRQAYQRGYVSRKTNVENQPIIKGKLGDYILAPAFNTT